MSQKLIDLNEAINILSAARMSCTESISYGWDKNFSAGQYLLKQIKQYFEVAE